MSGRLKLSSLVVLAVLVFGCGQILWRLTYDYNDNLYSAHSVQFVSGDSIYLAGITGEDIDSGSDHVFLARFGLDGSAIWETLIPGATGNSGRLATGKPLVVDANQNVFLAWSDVKANQIFIFKINPQGEVTDSWPLGNGTFVDDMILSTDGNLYLSVDKGALLYAYTTYGELLWSDTPGVNSRISHRSRLAQLPGNKLLVSTTNGMAVYSAAGLTLATLDSAAVETDLFSDAQVMNGRIWVALSSAGEGRLVALDSDLQIIEETSLGYNDPSVHLAADHGRICVVAGPGESGDGGVVRVHQVAPDGVVQAQTDVPVGGYEAWYFAKNIAAGQLGCYFGESYVIVSGSDVKSAVRLVRADGSVAAPWVLDDGVLEDFDVVGGDAIRSDMVGEYDDTYVAISLARQGLN